MTMKGDGIMPGIVIFIVGSMVGGFFGIALMCMLQICKDDIKRV